MVIAIQIIAFLNQHYNMCGAPHRMIFFNNREHLCVYHIYNNALFYPPSKGFELCELFNSCFENYYLLQQINVNKALVINS